MEGGEEAAAAAAAAVMNEGIPVSKRRRKEVDYSALNAQLERENGAARPSWRRKPPARRRTANPTRTTRTRAISARRATRRATRRAMRTTATSRCLTRMRSDCGSC